jgi:hypothetical protein
MTTVHRRTSEFPAFDAPPPKLLLALGSRALLEFAAGALLRRGLQRVAPRGDGHPVVLVLPGLGASDLSTRLLRRFLAGLGYQAICSKLGGVVARRGAIEPSLTGAENIHLRGVGHLGMAASPAALYACWPTGLHRPRATGSPFSPRPGNDCYTVCATTTLVPPARTRT